jgi:hypothetical protein
MTLGLSYVLIVTTDIPVLTIQYTPELKDRSININEDLEFNISMPNPGNVDFSTAIVYDYEIVGIKRFTFNVMRLKIWN